MMAEQLALVEKKPQPDGWSFVSCSCRGLINFNNNNNKKKELLSLYLP